VRRKIRIIRKYGSTEHEWIEKWNKEEIWSKFKNRGIILPEYSKLPNKEELRILTEEFIFEFNEYDRKGDKTHWRFVFKPGFIWDLASVPKILRGIVDNDSRSLRAAAMVHDACFALHLVDFKEADHMFYRIIKAHSGGFKGVLAFLAVRSPIGRRIYNDHNPESHWMNGFVECYKDGSLL
jgi:hypothetical protein